MENNMEKVVDLKETRGTDAWIENPETIRYIFDTRTFLNRLTVLCEEVSDENGIIEIPAEAFKDFKEKWYELNTNDDDIDLETIRIYAAELFGVNPETATIGTMFGFYKEDENHIYTTV
jgi:hypothetical protein